jgi:hypothetical protein
MLNSCHECCYATLIEAGTYQYYKCEIVETIRNDRERSGHVQLDGCKYFSPQSRKINRLETLIDK